MAEVFISYKSERRSAAQHLARVIELYGYSVWFDYWLVSGKDFGRQIERELNEAKAVVVLWCPLSRESEWVLEEAHFAQRHGKLAPAWLERVDPPLGFGRADTIDLTDWSGAPRGGYGFDRLLDEIARLVGREPRMPSWKEVRDYETTWRNFGSLRLAQFPLINPLHEREEARGLDENARREEEERERQEEERRKAAEAGRLEAERRAAEEAEARHLEEERHQAEAAEAQRIEEQRRKAAEAVRREQEQLAARGQPGAGRDSPVRPKPKTDFLAMLAIATVIALGGSWFAFAPTPKPVFATQQEEFHATANAQQIAFNAAMEADTVEVLDDFLAKFPSGPQADIIRKQRQRLVALAALPPPKPVVAAVPQTPLVANPGYAIPEGAGLVPQRRHTNPVVSVAFSPDGRWVVSGSWDKTLNLWEVESGKLLRTFEGHGDEVLSVAFSPDGRKLVSASKDHTLKLWEVASGKLLRTFEAGDEVRSVAFSPDGHWIVSGSDGNGVKLWDAQNGTLLRTFGAQLRTFDGKGQSVHSITFSPDGSLVVVANGDHFLNFWEVESGKLLRTFKVQSAAYAIAFSPDGRWLISGSWDATMTLWDVASGKPLRIFKGHSSWENSVAFSPDGRWIVSGSEDNTVKLWDAKNGKLLRTFKGHTGSVESVAFSPDGRWLISGSWDNTVKLWEAESGKLLRTF